MVGGSTTFALLLLLSVVANALVLGPGHVSAVAIGGGVAYGVRPRTTAIRAAESETAAPAELSSEGGAEAAQGEADDAEVTEWQGPGEGDFLRWYRQEKAKEEYEKENPTNVFEKAMSRLDGPLKTLAVLTAGYYAIPLVEGISQGSENGDIVGTVLSKLSRG